MPTNSNTFYLPSSDRISIAQLFRLFDNMSENYKIFWFMAIVDCVNAGKYRIKHLNDPYVRDKLFVPGISQDVFTDNLRELILPVYRAAENLGFEKRLIV